MALTHPTPPPPALVGGVDFDNPAWARAIEKARREQPASDTLTTGALGTHAWRVQGHGGSYVVTRRPDGAWRCTCRASGPCYHAAASYLAYVARPTYAAVRAACGEELARWLYAELIPTEPCGECRTYPQAAASGRCVECPAPADAA